MCTSWYHRSRLCWCSIYVPTRCNIKSNPYCQLVLFVTHVAMRTSPNQYHSTKWLISNNVPAAVHANNGQRGFTQR